MSSKKKKRNQEYLKRKQKRDEEKARMERYNNTMRNGTMEEMAAAMGVKLK